MMIYRPERFLGGGNIWYLRANGARVTEIRIGGWFAYHSKPGDVTFYSNVRPGVGNILPGLMDYDKKMITISVEAGKTYFVKLTPMVTIWSLSIRERGNLKSRA